MACSKQWVHDLKLLNPQDFKQTFQTFNNTSYNVTDQKSFYDVDVYLFEKQA